MAKDVMMICKLKEKYAGVCFSSGEISILLLFLLLLF